MSGHQNSTRFTKIIDLRPSMQAVSVQFIVLEKGEASIIKKQEGGVFKDLPSCFAVVADASGAVRFQAIGQDELDILQPSEILRMTGGLFMMEKAGALMRCGRKGLLERVGTFDMVYAEEPNMSNIQWTLDHASNSYTSNISLSIRPWQPPRH